MIDIAHEQSEGYSHFRNGLGGPFGADLKMETMQIAHVACAKSKSYLQQLGVGFSKRGEAGNQILELAAQEGLDLVPTEGAVPASTRRASISSLLSNPRTS